MLCVAAGAQGRQLPTLTSAVALVDSTARQWVRVLSDPPGGEIILDGAEDAWRTPADIELAVGQHRIELALAGHATLSHEFSLSEGQTLELQFILLRDRPEEPSPEELGLSYEALIPTLPEESATTTLERFLNLAEVFSVLPLGAGISLKVADQGEEHADALIIGGLTLTVASYATGTWLSSRRLRGIREENKRIQDSNTAAKLHNAAIDQQRRGYHDEQLAQWEEEALARGRVVERRRN